MHVPFVDLKAQYERYQTDIDRAIQSVISETAFISGKYATAFEQAFGAYTRHAHVLACANGTDAIELALDALGVTEGDEVIVPALSWISTSEAVGTRGATPVFVDIDETYTIDPLKIEERITERTKGIIPVHLYGCPANMPAIMKIAEAHDLFVVEDCAQAHGANINGQMVSTYGIAGTYSFYPGKNLGAYGDAGGLVTDQEEIADTARMLANHGQPKKHEHLKEGRNSRMDGLQAAILTAKLPHLETWTEERIQHARHYETLLQSNPDLTLPFTPENYRHVYHLYVIQHEDRDGLSRHLKNVGVQTSIHYPTPLPLLPCYEYQGHAAADFPVASKACERILSLPMFPELSQAQIGFVADQIATYGG